MKYEEEAKKIIETVLSKLYKTGKWKELSIGKDVIEEISGMIENTSNDLKARARDLLKAIEDNYESCKEAGIDDTGSYVRQQYIADEMEECRKAISSPSSRHKKVIK